jgi:protein-ribulosamine 3-kinase
MLTATLQNALKQILFQCLNTPAAPITFQAVGGGSINDTYKATLNQHNFFVKVNSAAKFPQLFQKEVSGLEFIHQQKIFRVPKIIENTIVEDQQVLVLEWIDSGIRTDKFWKKFGEQLAALHKVSNEYFGFAEDNYMGSVVQINNFLPDWISFFIQQRLQPLISQCRDKGLLSTLHVSLFEQLYIQLPQIFNKEPPALLHGDLWSGNYMCNTQSEPVLIDPATYFGHRSVDLGLTTLFGGFPTVFYDAYQYHYPLPENYKEQWQVSNLYALLIHLLLFGKSYLPQITHILEKHQ